MSISIPNHITCRSDLPDVQSVSTQPTLHNDCAVQAQFRCMLTLSNTRHNVNTHGSLAQQLHKQGENYTYQVMDDYCMTSTLCKFTSRNGGQVCSWNWDMVRKHLDKTVIANQHLIKFWFVDSTQTAVIMEVSTRKEVDQIKHDVAIVRARKPPETVPVNSTLAPTKRTNQQQPTPTVRPLRRTVPSMDNQS